jgi:Protein of unknown function (DUF2808)
MKTLTCVSVLALALLSIMPSAYAGVTDLSHFDRAVAIPTNSRLSSATYQLEFEVAGQPLEEILIDLPQGIQVKKGIEVRDVTNQIIATQISMQGRQTKLEFSQPVPVGTVIKVNLKGVHTVTPFGKAWMFAVSTRSTGMKTSQPLGVVGVTTRTPG